MKKLLQIRSLLLTVLVLFSSLSLSVAQVYNMNTSVVATCAGTFYDSGGAAGNYVANEAKEITFCPTTPGQYVQVTFNGAFNLENNVDFLIVYDGTTAGAVAIAVLTGTTTPGTFRASAANYTGCLTFVFLSNASTHRAGWSATVTCTSTPNASNPPVTNQDCITKTKICQLQAFSENNNGIGRVDDLPAAPMAGCLGPPLLGGASEINSSWYYFTAATSGTINFDIVPVTASDDYDFAIYGPNSTCPPTAAPTRCSFCATTGTTGVRGTAVDLSESAGSCDKFVSTLNAVAGQTYFLLINRFSGSKNGFTLSFSGTATLDCQSVFGVVPVTLKNYTVLTVNNHPTLKWTTAQESNSSHFIVARSEDGINFTDVAKITAQGRTEVATNYQYEDLKRAVVPTLFYRLTQVDFNGEKTTYLTLPYKVRLPLLSSSVQGSHKSLEVIFTTAENNSAVLKVLDIRGLEVYRQLVEGSQTVDLSHLNDGIYFCVLESVDGSVTTQKIQL